MISFVKMHALGNDFMLLDTRQQAMPLSTKAIMALADRHTGIGFDQLLCLAPSITPGVTVKYRIYNADGREVSQCGNGARCVAHYLYLEGHAKDAPVVLETDKGLITVTPVHALGLSHRNMLGDVGYYRAALATPQFDVTAIPVNPEGASMPRKSWLAWQYRGKTYEGALVNVGNPHWIIPVDAWDTEMLSHIGQALNDEAVRQGTGAVFPEGVNVTWLQCNDNQSLSIETFERGVGLTRACGSAAAAAAVVAISEGWCDNHASVSMPGGQVWVTWAEAAQMVDVTGEAVLLYRAKLEGLP